MEVEEKLWVDKEVHDELKQYGDPEVITASVLTDYARGIFFDLSSNPKGQEGN